MAKLHIVLLSGGSGTRLWPLSSGARSKQFLKVLDDGNGGHQSMVQRVFSQIKHVLPEADVTVATCAEQVGLLESQIVGGHVVCVEPERRDTAPAIMLACAHLAWEQHADLDDTVVVMPIDSYVDDEYFTKALEVSNAVQEGAGDIVLIGVEPTHPAEKYGYIVPSMSEGSPRAVGRFIEKPKEATAKELIKQGALWNCGSFGFKLSYLLKILQSYGEQFVSYQDTVAHYEELPKNSFDYEIVEKAKYVAVIPYAGAWKDLGTWATLTEEMTDLTSGDVILEDATCKNVHVINKLDRPVVVAGVADVVVVVTDVGILVCGKEESSRLKDLVRKIS